VVIQQFLDGDGHRRAAAPDRQQQIRPEAAVEDAKAQLETVVEQLIGVEVEFVHCGGPENRALILGRRGGRGQSYPRLAWPRLAWPCGDTWAMRRKRQAWQVGLCSIRLWSIGPPGRAAKCQAPAFRGSVIALLFWQ